MTSGVDDAGTRGAWRARLQNRGDVVALDKYGAALEDCAGFVHDDDGAAIDEEGGVWEGCITAGGRGRIARAGEQGERGQGERGQETARLLTTGFVHHHATDLNAMAIPCQR